MSPVWERENIIVLIIIAISKYTNVMTTDAFEIPNRNFESERVLCKHCVRTRHDMIYGVYETKCRTVNKRDEKKMKAMVMRTLNTSKWMCGVTGSDGIGDERTQRRLGWQRLLGAVALA